MESRRVAILGVSGSGKTELVQRLYLRTCPRLIVVDQTGEWKRKYPEWPTATGLEMVLRTLQGFARQHAEHWHLIAYLRPWEVEDLAGYLIPLGDVYDKSPVRHMGGFAVYLDEVDILLPATYVPESMRSLYRRGRHASLTLFSATQKPGSTSKEITGNATAVHIFPLHEPGCQKYVADLIGKERAMETWRFVTARPYRYVTYHPRTGELTHHEPEGSRE